jgi:hypothetical protein
VKLPIDIVADLDRRLERTWAQTLSGEGETSVWPKSFALSNSSSRAIEADFVKVVGVADEWHLWAQENNVERSAVGTAAESASPSTLAATNRRIGSTVYEIPSHLVVASAAEAARLCGSRWAGRLKLGERRLSELRRRFPELGAYAGMLRAVIGFTDVDFELLLRAGDWFAANSAMALTPRQVPLEGFHAKWLNTRQGLVATLAGKPDLELAPNHPSRIHFSYLDPDHLAAGGRKYDSATIGDSFTPAYAPRVVIISENKDTAVNFPNLLGAISIEGEGSGGSTFASFAWITQAPIVIYWGDMDADGLEILNGFRAAGVPARSMLMNAEVFARWERFGTNVDKRGRPLTARAVRQVPHLSGEERALYEDLLDPLWRRVRRVEQERIPLAVARAAARAVVAQVGAAEAAP